MVLPEYFEDYREIVSKHQQIAESHKRFYIIWSELFLDYLDRNNIAEKKVSENEKLTNFINYLHENNKYQDWQINQAIDAINLLYSLIKDKSHDDPISLDFIIDKIKNIIKLKHYSGKTEKNYVYWVKQFYHYIQKNISDCDSSDVKNFLTHPAKEKMSQLQHRIRLLMPYFFYSDMSCTKI